MLAMLERCFAIICAEHDDDCVYELPYEEGRAFRVSQGYGGTHSHNGSSHYSLDFAMPEGTNVCAARSGVVVAMIDHNRLGGTSSQYKRMSNYVEILHQDYSVAHYAHLGHGGVHVKCGQHVKAGDVIGFSGNTGWSCFPHLHFHVVAGVYWQRVPTKFRTTFSRHAIFLRQGKRYRRPTSPNLLPVALVYHCTTFLDWLLKRLSTRRIRE